ncbi:MAG: ExbD/TolR family protein [Phycisphaerales bacterium]
MNFTRRAHREAYIQALPLIALIDVVLFLLLYFIMAGTLADPETDLSAAISPTLRGSGRGNDFSSQIVHVEVESGRVRFRIADRAFGSRDELSAVLAQLPKEPGVIIRVADDATVGAGAAAIQAARDAGFNKVTYVASK